MSNQLSNLNQSGLWYDSKTMDIFTEDDVLVCGVEIEETRKGTIYVNLYFDGAPFKYYEDDICDADINEEIKLELLNLFNEFREIQEQRKEPDPDHEWEQWK